MTNSKNRPPTKKQEDSAGLSKNHSKSVKFRLRVQQQKEATETIKEYVEEQQRPNRVY